MSRLVRLAWLIGGVAVLWFIARSTYVEQWMRRVIGRALNRWTDLEVRDYANLLKLSGEYTVREVKVREQDWLAEKKLKNCRLTEEGVLILGINRSDGSYVGALVAETRIYAGDTLILYGRGGTLKNLDERQAGLSGEAEHQEAKQEQQREEAEQVRQESEYRRKKQEKKVSST